MVPPTERSIIIAMIEILPIKVKKKLVQLMIRRHLIKKIYALRSDAITRERVKKVISYYNYFGLFQNLYYNRYFTPLSSKELNIIFLNNAGVWPIHLERTKLFSKNFIKKYRYWIEEQMKTNVEQMKTNVEQPIKNHFNMEKILERLFYKSSHIKIKYPKIPLKSWMQNMQYMPKFNLKIMNTFLQMLEAVTFFPEKDVSNFSLYEKQPFIGCSLLKNIEKINVFPKEEPIIPLSEQTSFFSDLERKNINLMKLWLYETRPRLNTSYSFTSSRTYSLASSRTYWPKEEQFITLNKPSFCSLYVENINQKSSTQWLNELGTNLKKDTNYSNLKDKITTCIEEKPKILKLNPVVPKKKEKYPPKKEFPPKKKVWYNKQK